MKFFFPYLLTVLFTLLTISCMKHDGIESARLDKINILNTPDGDQVVHVSRGDSWVTVELLGAWYKLDNVESVVIEGNGCRRESFSGSFSTFTTTKIITTIDVCSPGTYNIYIHDGDSELFYSSNHKSITFYY